MDTVKQLMVSEDHPTEESPAEERPAAAAWRAYERRLAELARAQEPLAKRRDEHSALVDRVADVRSNLAAAVQDLKSARADALNGDASDAAVKVAGHAVTTLRAQLADLEPQAEVAALALSRIAEKINAISASVAEVQRQAPRLRQDALLEEMAQRSPCFKRSLKTFLDEYTELASLARAHDELCNASPGSTGIHSGRMFELSIFLPTHSSYSQSPDYDFRRQIDARVAKLLAGVPRSR